MLRSCLEHAVLDWLLFLGHTYVQHVHGVSDQHWAECQADLQNGADWTTGIVRMSRTRKGDVTIIRRGLYSAADADGRRDQLSIYYFLLDEYEGFLGKPADQRDDDFLTREQLRAQAATNQQHWHVYLRWSALLENLEVNGLVDESDRGRLSVHYAFLSTFAHPVSNIQEHLYGTRLDGVPPSYDHYSSELVLLYVSKMAALELENYLAGVEMQLGVSLKSADELTADIHFASETSNYFWFLGTTPHAWDFHRAKNSAAIQSIREGDLEESAVPGTEEASFPRDPLSRLVSQHKSSRGRVPGAEYISPWPRVDAIRRR